MLSIMSLCEFTSPFFLIFLTDVWDVGLSSRSYVLAWVQPGCYGCRTAGQPITSGSSTKFSCLVYSTRLLVCSRRLPISMERRVGS